MLDGLFLSVLNMSLVASYGIVFVLLARLALKKAPRMFSYALWSVVLFRLLCPFSFEGAFSLIPIGKTAIPQDIIYSETPQISTGMTVVDNIINPVLPAPTEIGASINPLQVWIFIGEILWILGILVMAGYGILSFVKLKRSLVTSTPQKGNIYLADHIATPFVLGVLKPKIYLPSSLLESEQSYIIRHELCHIKRLDHITRILGFIALSVHWFNPLVWVAFALSGKDMELSCDEAVMKNMDGDIKAEYSQSLLRLGTTKKMLHATPLAFGEGDTKSRVKNVLHYKKPAFWVMAVSVAAVICIIVGLLFSPKEKPTGFAGINATILTIDKNAQTMTVTGIDPNSAIGDYCIVTYKGAELLTLATNSEPKSISIDDFSEGDPVILFIGEIQETYPTSAMATTIQLQPSNGSELGDLRPMVMLHGDLYLDTGEAGPMGDAGAVSGTIKSTVGRDEKPTEHEQSNFGFVGSEYAGDGDFIQVNIEDKWIVFEREKQLPLTKETARELIRQTLSTFQLNADDTVSFTLPAQIPVDESGKTKLVISASATFAPEPGTSSVQEILDWNVSAKTGMTHDWQGGERYTEALELSRGKLTRLFLRVAFMTTKGEASYRDYAADFIELTEPFTVDAPVRITDRSVEIEQAEASSVLTYTMQNGDVFSVTLTLPSGLALSTSEKYPTYTSDIDGEMPTVVVVKDGNPIGTLTLGGFGTDDKETFAQIDTTKNEIPMPIFAGIALSNHAGYENYTVCKASATGANAIAEYAWQDLTGYGGNAPAAPWFTSDCILAYDYEKAPFFIHFNLTKDSLSRAELENLAKSIAVMD